MAFSIDLEKQKAKADAFRARYRGPRILLLPNVWDVASARAARCEIDRAAGARSTVSSKRPRGAGFLFCTRAGEAGCCASKSGFGADAGDAWAAAKNGLGAEDYGDVPNDGGCTFPC